MRSWIGVVCVTFGRGGAINKTWMHYKVLNGHEGIQEGGIWWVEKRKREEKNVRIGGSILE